MGQWGREELIPSLGAHPVPRAQESLAQPTGAEVVTINSSLDSFIYTSSPSRHI